MSSIDSNYSGGVESVFPTGGLVPKAETGVINFLQKYPDFNGRDVTIAIFDSGVDPRAVGLETLCDGKTPKVIERYDCTGCGDVDVTTKVTADDEGFITGLSGRKLKLTKQMIETNTAAGEFRVGLKTLYEICPSKVCENITKIIKTKEWDAPHKTATAEIARKLSDFEARNIEIIKLPWDKKVIKEDMEGTMEMLNAYEKQYNEIKISYDCVLYPTESGWHAVIDTTEKGDLENAVHIREYSKTYEVKNVNDYLSISINVHDEGNVLEIVGMCSSHGTHVASIASGNHFSNDLNGLAPNAKIVSLTIGEGRLGSMETGTALVRAMIKVMEMCRSGRQIDVINMSYGEHAHWANAGRIGELMSEVVNKYGVVWVASAGNHGPALCTVGAPPDIKQPSCIGVGAFVSPQMMEAEYALREKLPGNVYTWSSRDPCIDGGQGVTVCAPGGAIASVPQFTMSKSQLMNGTSMAAPHVAGAIALLISGLKAKNIKYSPYSIKRSICATATKLSYVDPFAQGSGLLNVEKAFEHLVQYEKAPDNMLRFSVTCGPQYSKGIHIREGPLTKPFEYVVNIEPIFCNENETAPKDKFSYNVRLTLVSSHPFVQCGSFLDLSYAPRSLLVKVDPVGLPPGISTAVIRAYDSDCVQRGALFEIPVTVVQPHVLNSDESRIFKPFSGKSDGSIEFNPSTIQRDFIFVPKHATWAILRMRSTDKKQTSEGGKLFVHTVQLLPKSSCRNLETMKILSVTSEVEATLAIKCQENNIMELCVVKYWSNLGNIHVQYSLEFHGIEARNPNAYIMNPARGIHKLEVSALVSEELQPQLQLKTAVVVLKPTEAKISPLSATRDVIPEGRQIYQNLLSYNLHVNKNQEVSIYAPIFNSLLYESEYESQLWMLFDANKMLHITGDAHSHSFYTKLEKGDYTLKLQIRHEKRETLEKIADATMLVLFKLSNSISLDLYENYNQCVVGHRKFSTGIAKNVPPKCLYVAPLTQEKLSKASLPSNCAWLSGALILAKDELARRVDVQEFTYYLCHGEGAKKNGNGNSNNTLNAANCSIVAKNKNGAPAAAAAAVALHAVNSTVGDGLTSTSSFLLPTETSSPKKNKTTSDEYAEALRDFQSSMIGKCELENAEKIYEEVLAKHPKHLAAHLMLIQNIDSTDLKPVSSLPMTFTKFWDSVQEQPATSGEIPDVDMEKVCKSLKRIIHLADLIIKDTDKTAILSFMGLKYDPRPEAAKIKTNTDKLKSNLLEALAKKGIALCKLAAINKDKKDSTEELDSIYTEILKFVDATDSKVIQFSLWHAYAHKHYGRMYKYLHKMHDDKRNREALEEVALIAGALNYIHVQTAVRRYAISAFPQNYRLF